MGEEIDPKEVGEELLELIAQQILEAAQAVHAVNVEKFYPQALQIGEMMIQAARAGDKDLIVECKNQFRMLANLEGIVLEKEAAERWEVIADVTAATAMTLLAFFLNSGVDKLGALLNK